MGQRGSSGGKKWRIDVSKSAIHRGNTGGTLVRPLWRREQCAVLEGALSRRTWVGWWVSLKTGEGCFP